MDKILLFYATREQCANNICESAISKSLTLFFATLLLLNVPHVYALIPTSANSFRLFLDDSS